MTSSDLWSDGNALAGPLHDLLRVDVVDEDLVPEIREARSGHEPDVPGTEDDQTHVLRLLVKPPDQGKPGTSSAIE